MLKGCFITIEGIDGAGKTCHLNWIKYLLEQAGKTVVCTREPGGTPLGEEIRAVLLQHRTNGIDPISELFLLCAARAEHITQIIVPSLMQGKWVLSDRFSDATYAYQGGGRRINPATIAVAESIFNINLQPDFTLLLDVPVEVGKIRRQHRTNLDRFDQEEWSFFQRVRNAYLHRAAMFSRRIRVINAASELNQVTAEITKQIQDILTLS